MMRSLWISKSGMEAQQTQLDHISNNLANSGTNGYKQSHAVFEDLMYQTLRQSGANSSEQSTLPTGLQVGLGVRPVATSRQFTQGSLQQTSGNLDVAINGKGFFEVTLPDGRIGYTRDGAFQLDNQGRIVTNNGYLVNTNGATVPAEATNITISADGIISAKLAGETEPAVIGRFQISNFVNAPGLDPIGQNTYVESVASGPPQSGNPQSGSLGSLSQGFVETSNVNVVQELVQMIQTQRAYELNSKAIQTSDQMLQKLGQL
ncbi:flagellar basal-body rod protein FlgG [uncultured Aquabacterium sp.]|uniref:flagellar basal-body rod protein FlgG n=1 Tax=Aquabacterium sp. TaxID=1872578 RepID=UPI0025E2A621|nr:flagellar basal-body rod protein FlgG [uncultured Aquabacterium sp.]